MPADPDLLDFTAEIVTTYVARTSADVEQLSELIKSVHRTLVSLSSGQGSALGEQEQPKPAVPIKHSVTPNYIICLECGMRTVVLKRHLANQHGLTSEAYRARWGLPYDYPMVASGSSKRRAALAKQIGLGRLGLVARIPTTPAR